MSIRKITVIGLGEMGTPIASFLLKAGYEVTGFDLRKEQMTRLIPLGLIPADCPWKTVRGVDLIMLSLPSWGAVREVVEGKEGILKAARPGPIIIDTSTVPPWESKEMARRLAAKGIDWVDAPISGAANQARVGNMVFMVGGKRSVFLRIKPVLDRVGKKTVYVGKSGDALMLKLVVNQVLFLNQAAAIEGFVHGLKAGLDPDVMLDVLISGAAGSDLIASRGRDMLRGNFEKKGPVWLALKDLGLALESSKQLGIILPFAALYHQLLLQATYNGWERQDATVVMKIYEELARIKRGKKAKSKR
jgi:3-hydroxyisobutyrate dehydrogenase-like beta-hydroxyacid dehydrogenase